MNSIRKRKESRSALRKIINSRQSVLVIHYAHSFLDETNNEQTPMITAIIIKSIDGRINECFSIEIEADLVDCPRDELIDLYPELELSLLEKFKTFVRRHINGYWIHWEMNNYQFGFQAIKHRYAKLAGESKGREFAEIPHNRKVDLSRILADMYGDGYANDDDKLYQIINHNEWDSLNYLNLPQEEYEFQNLNYRTVYNSVYNKVCSIEKILKKLSRKSLRIPNKNNYSIFIDIITHPIFTFIGWLATILALILTILYLIG